MTDHHTSQRLLFIKGRQPAERLKVEPDMTARYDRTAHYVTITDDRIGDILVQRCRSIAEARKIARAHGTTLTEA